MSFSESDLSSILSKGHCKVAGKVDPLTAVIRKHGFEGAQPVKEQSKYRNKPVSYGGARFDSQGELNRYIELERLESAGVISDLRRQVPFVVIPPLVMDGKHVQATVYRADYVYKENGAEVVEDFKGVRTEGYILKRKLMFHVHGIVIRETGRNG